MDITGGRATVYDYTSSTFLKKSFFFDSPGFDVAGWDVSLDAKGDKLLYKAKGPIMYEKTGIPVSTEAPFPGKADYEAGIDPGLEKALEQF